MASIDFVPSISVATVLGIVAWLCRKLIITRLTRAVGHEYDEKLEKLRSELKRSDEVSLSLIRKSEEDLSALRNALLGPVSARRVALAEKQIEAAEKLWSVVVRYGAYRPVLATLSVLRYDYVLRETAARPEARKFFQTMLEGFKIQEVSSGDAEEVRIFVSTAVWALYSAYAAICATALMRFKILTTGLGDTKLIDQEKLMKLVVEALPHQSQFLKENGLSATDFVLVELEQKLLAEIQSMLSGKDTDSQELERATKLIAGLREIQSQPEKDAAGVFGSSS